jgi:hypothetical protein
MEEAGPLPPLFLRTNFVIVSKLTEEKLWGRGGGGVTSDCFHLWHKIYQICDFQIVIKCVENAWHSISHTPKIETFPRPLDNQASPHSFGTGYAPKKTLGCCRWSWICGARKPNITNVTVWEELPLRSVQENSQDKFARPWQRNFSGIYVIILPDLISATRSRLITIIIFLQR